MYTISPHQKSNVAMDAFLLSSNTSLIEGRNNARSWGEPELKGVATAQPFEFHAVNPYV